MAELTDEQRQTVQLMADAEIGRQWREDSSLEKWFPISAEMLKQADWGSSHYRELMERHRNDSHRYQALLYHAWKVIREQQKGLKHQQRKLKRLRADYAARVAYQELDMAKIRQLPRAE